MTALRCLVDWPQVLVDVECSLCPRRGRYRLARLAERYGAAVPLGRLLEFMAADCTLMKPGEKPRQYEARCGIRYVVPPGGPLPADAPVRAGAPRLDPPKRSGKKRLGYAGPLPTIADTLATGPQGVMVYCAARRPDGRSCHHISRVLLADLKLSPDLPYVHIPRAGVLRCSRCGSRSIEVRPDWPDPRTVRAASFGVDLRPTLPS